MLADTRPDVSALEALDWEIPCRPWRHECDRAAEWAYEHTPSCGCHWEVFYCSPCREKQLEILASVPAKWICHQCGAAATSITTKWWPLHG